MQGSYVMRALNNEVSQDFSPMEIGQKISILEEKENMEKLLKKLKCLMDFKRPYDTNCDFEYQIGNKNEMPNYGNLYYGIN